MTVTYQEEGEGEQRVENIKLLQITSTTIQVRTLLTPSFSCCAACYFLCCGSGMIDSGSGSSCDFLEIRIWILTMLFRHI